MDDSVQERILELLDEDKSANEIVKILKDEGVKISKATINRTRRLTRALGDDKKLSPEERDVYLSYMKKTIEQKEKRQKIWHTIFHPITRTAVDGPFDPNMPEISENGHQSFLNSYIPKNSFEAIDVDVDDKGKIQSEPVPFTAKKKGLNTIPKFFWNPYTALDLIVFQDVYTHTVCGTIIDILVAFSVGMGIHPVLKLIDKENVEVQEKKLPEKSKPTLDKEPENNESKDDITPTQEKPKPVMETKQEALERILHENKQLLEPLIAVDNSFGDQENNEGIAEDWNTKVEALVRNHWIFGRDLMTMEPDQDKPFEWNGKKWPNIRNVAKVQHPRDINFIEIEQKTFNILRVSLMFSPAMLERSDMIYLAHMENSPIYNGKGYGYSLEQRMLGDGRSLRKLKDRDFPNIASIGYAPFTIVATKRDEKGTNNEATQGQTFINTMVAGQPNHVALKDPQNDLVVHHIDTKPDIAGIIEMAKYHTNAAAKSAQVPTTLVGDEKDPNRDTLLGILRMFSEVEIPRKRLPITRVFTHQHYMPNFREFYKDKPEILKKFRVEAEFTDVKIDSWADIVTAFIELNKIFRFTADAAGEMLGIENLEGKIDTEKEPLGESNMMQDGDGNTLTMTKGPPKPNSSKSAAYKLLSSKKNEDGKWLTVKGSHIFIPEGEDKGEVIKKFFKEKENEDKKTNVKEQPKHIKEAIQQINNKIDSDGIGASAEILRKNIIPIDSVVMNTLSEKDQSSLKGLIGIGAFKKSDEIIMKSVNSNPEVKKQWDENQALIDVYNSRLSEKLKESTVVHRHTTIEELDAYVKSGVFGGHTNDFVPVSVDNETNMFKDKKPVHIEYPTKDLDIKSMEYTQLPRSGLNMDTERFDTSKNIGFADETEARISRDTKIPKNLNISIRSLPDPFAVPTDEFLQKKYGSLGNVKWTGRKPKR